MWVRRKEWEKQKAVGIATLRLAGALRRQVSQLEDEVKAYRTEFAVLQGTVTTLKEIAFGTPTPAPAQSFTDEEALAIERMTCGGAAQIGEPNGRPQE